MRLKSKFVFGEPVTVVTRTQTGVDGYGDPIYDTTSVTVQGAFAPGESVEQQTAGSDQVLIQPHVFLPYGTVIDSNATMTVRGRTWEVGGEPQPWRSPFTGWEAGVRVDLKAVTG